MNRNHLIKLSFIVAFGQAAFIGCKSVNKDAATKTVAYSASTANFAGPQKILEFARARITTATYSSVDSENSRFLKTVMLDYPVVRGYFVGQYTHVPSRDNKKVHVYEGPTKVTMQTAEGLVEEIVTGAVFVQRDDMAKGNVTSDSLSYQFALGSEMIEPVEISRNRIKPQSSSASASGSFMAVAAAAMINAAVNEAEEASAAPVLTFHGNEDKDFRKNYYGKDVDAADQVVVIFLDEPTPSEQPR